MADWLVMAHLVWDWSIVDDDDGLFAYLVDAGKLPMQQGRDVSGANRASVL